MCLPIAAPLALAAATTVLSAGQSIMGYFGQNAAYDANKQAANQNFSAKVEQVSQANSQLSGQQAEQNLSDAVTAAQSFGRVASSASSLGLGASTAHQYFAAASAANNRAIGLTDANYANRRQAYGTELKGADIERRSQIASVPSGSFGQLIMGIAGAGMKGATTYQAMGGKF